MNQNFMSQLAGLEALTNNKNKTVSKQDYEKFCNEFVFAKLKEKSFGEAFCERFSLNDIFLKSLSDETAKFHIEALGYIK
jgi:hypothetical protein